MSSALRRLGSATAAMGATTAQLFPSVSFTGFVGFNRVRHGDLSKSGARTYGVGPGISWNLLDSGRIRARIARADVALATYERAAVQALQDAETSLVRLDPASQQASALEASADAARTATRLASFGSKQVHPISSICSKRSDKC